MLKKGDAVNSRYMSTTQQQAVATYTEQNTEKCLLYVRTIRKEIQVFRQENCKEKLMLQIIIIRPFFTLSLRCTCSCHKYLYAQIGLFSPVLRLISKGSSRVII